MEFFRKVKQYVTGQTEAAQGPTAGVSPSPKIPQTRAAVTYRQPILQNAGFGTAGGVQGLEWYKANLKQDRDGDVADEFLLERSDESTKGPSEGLQSQKRHLRQPVDSAVLVEGGNVYVVPNT
ncbi:hypothetical protein ABBQ38_010050 [Trebouxia sp. C0009 RCD-2024]